MKVCHYLTKVPLRLFLRSPTDLAILRRLTPRDSHVSNNDTRKLDKGCHDSGGGSGGGGAASLLAAADEGAPCFNRSRENASVKQ